MPIFGNSKVGDSCYIDPDALVGYPHNGELDKDREDVDGSVTTGGVSSGHPGCARD